MALDRRRFGPLGVIGALLTAVLVVLIATGCGAKSDNSGGSDTDSSTQASLGNAEAEDVPSLKGMKIGISGLSTEDYFSRSAYEGAIDRVKELGGTPIAVNAEQDPQKMVANLENLISQKPAAIISHGTQPQIIEPIYKKIRDAGIPLLTIDTPSPYSVNNSESDNYTGGAQLAIALAQSIGGKGNVLVFNAFSNALRVLGIRYNEFKEVLTDYPEIKILEPELQDVVTNTTEDARQKTQDALQKYGPGEISAIWAGWDPPAIGAAQAVDAAGRQDEIHVFGFNGEPQVVDMIASESSFTADTGIKAFVIGQTAIDNAARVLAGDEESVPPTSYVEPVLITKENVAQAKRELAGGGN